jgi:hypothetical protein
VPGAAILRYPAADHVAVAIARKPIGIRPGWIASAPWSNELPAITHRRRSTPASSRLPDPGTVMGRGDATIALGVHDDRAAGSWNGRIGSRTGASGSPGREVVDKRVYSPWMENALDERLRIRNADTLVVTGGETDVCVFATALGAIDRGYRVVIATDAVCSSSDAAHDASMELYHARDGQQVETADCAEILNAWH